VLRGKIIQALLQFLHPLPKPILRNHNIARDARAHCRPWV
jgi:hypothetical protein